jgi:hypothetical protein
MTGRQMMAVALSALRHEHVIQSLAMGYGAHYGDTMQNMFKQLLIESDCEPIYRLEMGWQRGYA